MKGMVLSAPGFAAMTMEEMLSVDGGNDLAIANWTFAGGVCTVGAGVASAVSAVTTAATIAAVCTIGAGVAAIVVAVIIVNSLGIESSSPPSGSSITYCP